MTAKLKFQYFRKFWITDFGWPDISFGIHFCFDGRIDIHILQWMISVGKVPIYQNKDKLIAVSNSFHNKTSTNIRERSLP